MNNYTVLFIELFPYSGAPNGLMAQLRYMASNTNVTAVVISVRGSIFEDNTEKLPYQYYSVDNVWLHYFFRNPIKYCIPLLKSLLFIAGIIIKHRVSIIHCNHYYWSAYGTILGYLFRLPVVIHLKDVHQLEPRVNRFLMRWYPRTTYIAVSRYVKQLFCEKFGITKDKIITIYDGIDSSFFKPVSDGVLHSKRRKIIVMLSRVAQERNIEVFIDTAALLKSKYPNLRFIHYGMVDDDVQKTYFSKLRTRVNSLKIGKNFRFSPYERSTEKVVRAFREAFLSMVTTPDFALPNVAIESLLCGVPVLAPEGGGNNEIIINRYNGSLIRSNAPMLFAAEIEKFILGKYNYTKMRENSIKFARKTFDARQQYKKIAELYVKLLFS